jgi:hypothetical protein
MRCGLPQGAKLVRGPLIEADETIALRVALGLEGVASLPTGREAAIASKAVGAMESWLAHLMSRGPEDNGSGRWPSDFIQQHPDLN